MIHTQFTKCSVVKHPELPHHEHTLVGYIANPQFEGLAPAVTAVLLNSEATKSAGYEDNSKQYMKKFKISAGAH